MRRKVWNARCEQVHYAGWAEGCVEEAIDVLVNARVEG